MEKKKLDAKGNKLCLTKPALHLRAKILDPQKRRLGKEDRSSTAPEHFAVGEREASRESTREGKENQFKSLKWSSPE